MASTLNEFGETSRLNGKELCAAPWACWSAGPFEFAFTRQRPEQRPKLSWIAGKRFWFACFGRFYISGDAARQAITAGRKTSARQGPEQPAGVHPNQTTQEDSPPAF